MTCLIFLCMSSPCSAIYIKNTNALRYKSSEPDAVKSIIKDSYMHNFPTSRKTLLEAQDLVQDVMESNSEANFAMHSWVSNDTRGLSPVTETEHLNTSKFSNFYDEKRGRVLGLFWDQKEDVLGFNVGWEKNPGKYFEK